MPQMGFRSKSFEVSVLSWILSVIFLQGSIKGDGLGLLAWWPADEEEEEEEEAAEAEAEAEAEEEQ